MARARVSIRRKCARGSGRASPDARPRFAGADRDRPRPRGRPRTAAAGRSPSRCRRSPRQRAEAGSRQASSHAASRATLPSRMLRMPALAPVKTPSASASSVAISASAAKPRAAAIGSVRKRLVAVVSTSRSPASRWPATSARAASPRRGSTRVCTKRSRSGAQACGVRPWQRRRVEGAELGRRDRAGAIALDDAAVARFEVGAIEHALVHQELAPELVGVAVEQRPVEVEQRQRGRSVAQRRSRAGARPSAA